MRVTRQQSQENRQRVLCLAARRFREQGFQGLGVAELMAEAGLTHGGFYKQFASKDDLAAEAGAKALAENLATYETLAKRHLTISGVTTALLTERHRDNPGTGCMLAALGTDIARAGPGMQRTTTGGVRKLLDCLAALVPGRPKKKARERALAAYATMVGALVVARAVDDPALSREILLAARASLSRPEEEAG